MEKFVIIDQDPEHRDAWRYLLTHLFQAKTKNPQIELAESFAAANLEEAKTIVIGQLPENEKPAVIIEQNQKLWPKMIVCGDGQIMNLCEIYGVIVFPRERVLPLRDDLQTCKRIF